MSPVLDAAAVIVQSTSPSSTASSRPVSVTVCAALQFAAVNVSVVEAPGAALPTDTRHSPALLLDTVTVTFAVGCVASATLNVAVPPASVTVSCGAVFCASPVTVTAASSLSVSVSVAPVTAPAPWLFCAVPVTAPLRSDASSRKLSTAVIRTVSASVVIPAAITIVASASTVYRPLTAVTVTVVAALEVVPVSVAVTSAVPPFSAIMPFAGVSDNDTAGAASSSVSVTAAPVTDSMPLAGTLLLAVPVTVTGRFGSSRVLFVAVSVAERSVAVPASELEVSPASMVSVVRFSVVPVGADSVIVVAAPEARFSVAVIVAVPPFSEIDAADDASVTVGAASSSVLRTVNVVLAKPSYSSSWLGETPGDHGSSVIVQSRSPSSTLSFWPVSVTSCGVLQAVVENDSRFDAAGVALPAVDTRHSPSSLLITSTFTECDGFVASAILNAAVPPPSVTVSRGFVADASSVSASAAVSLSVTVSVAVPLPWPLADAVIVTCLSPWSS